MGSFSSKPALTPQEQMKEYKREIDRACRELDRERRKLEMQQQKTEGEIRKAAKMNQMAAVKIMAKDYVRCKKHVQKFYMMRTQLQGVGLQLQTMKSADAMANAMKSATKAMVSMNKRMNLPALTEIMSRFQLESSVLENTQEIMSDAVDSALAGEDEEEEEDAVVKQVFAELSLKMGDDLLTAPTGAAAVAAPAAPVRAAVAPGGHPPPPGGGAGEPPSGGAGGPPPPAAGAGPGGGGGGGDADLMARFASLKK